VEPKTFLSLDKDDSKDLPGAIESMLTKTYLYSCMNHQIRTSLAIILFKGCKAAAADLQASYAAAPFNRGRSLTHDAFDEK
jgi:hypothetical protein